MPKGCVYFASSWFYMGGSGLDRTMDFQKFCIGSDLILADQDWIWTEKFLSPLFSGSYDTLGTGAAQRLLFDERYWLTRAFGKAISRPNIFQWKAFTPEPHFTGQFFSHPSRLKNLLRTISHRQLPGPRFSVWLRWGCLRSECCHALGKIPTVGIFMLL